MSTITQTVLAELAGVSQNTVCRALHGRPGISEKTRQHIHELAVTHGYRLNTTASNMRTGRTSNIGMLVFDRPDKRYVHPALLELTWGVNEGLDEAGYIASLVRLADVDKSGSGRARIFSEHLLDGVIVANMLPELLLRKVEELVPACVWLDTNVWRPNDCVQRDELHAGRVAAQALIAAGHRRIIYFIRPDTTWVPNTQLTMSHYSNLARQRGLEIEASEAGVELVPIVVPDLSMFDVASIEKYLKQGVGVFTKGLSEARRIVVSASRLSGLQWGIDYSVVCADDAIDLEWWWPELTRVRFDRLAMGRVAAQLMVAKLNNDVAGTASQQVVGELIPGSSVRPA